MTELKSQPDIPEKQKRAYWGSVGLRARDAMQMHKLTGQLEKGDDSWRNVSEHCLVQVARSEILAEMLGLPEYLVQNMRVGAMLHDFDKKNEMRVIRAARGSEESPLKAARTRHLIDDMWLEDNGYNKTVRELAGAAGVDAPQLVKAQQILDGGEISDEDLAWLVIHYVDNCSIGSDWILPSHEGRNIIDFRMKENAKKPDYEKISQEITQEPSYREHFGETDLYVTGAQVSHEIEQRFAQIIQERRGETVEPLSIPEIVDQRIKEGIASFSSRGISEN
jgi:hypothetical protein